MKENYHRIAHSLRGTSQKLHALIARLSPNNIFESRIVVMPVPTLIYPRCLKFNFLQIKPSISQMPAHMGASLSQSDIKTAKAKLMMKRYFRLIIGALISNAFAATSHAEANLLTKIKSYWDPRSKLEANGVDVSAKSLFKAIDNLDVGTVKDLLGLLSSNEIQKARDLQNDPGLEIDKSVGVKSNLKATFYDIDEIVNLAIDPTDPPMVHLTVLGAAAGKFMKTIQGAGGARSEYMQKREKAFEIAKMVFAKFTDVRPAELKFMTLRCSIQEDLKVALADKSSEFAGTAKKSADACFLLNNQLLRKEINISERSTGGIVPTYYLSHLIFSTDEYDEKTITRHFEFWSHNQEYYEKSPTASASSMEPRKVVLSSQWSFNPFVVLLIAPGTLELFKGYNDDTHKKIVSILKSISRNVNHEFFYKALLHPDFYNQMTTQSRAAQKTNSKIYDYQHELGSYLGVFALEDCKAGKSIFPCWAAEELLGYKTPIGDQTMLCSKGVGYACDSLASIIAFDDKSKKTSSSDRDAALNTVQKQCHNNIHHSCLGLSRLREKFAGSLKKKSYNCDRASIEDCFLTSDLNKDSKYMKKACGLGNADACIIVSIDYIKEGNTYLGNEFYDQSCKLQKLQGNLRPHDAQECEKVPE